MPVMPTSPAVVDEDELDLRAYLAVLRRRWLPILLVTLVVVISAVGLSATREAQYEASADLLIRQRSTESLFSDGEQVRNNQDASRLLNNEVKVLESGQVRTAVDERYDGPLDPEDVSASIDSDTSDVVEVSVTSALPEEGARLVNTYVETFIEIRRQQRVDELLLAGVEIQAQVDDLEARIAAAREPLTAAEAALAEQPGSSALQGQRDDVAEQIAGELAPLESQQAFYQQQLEDLQLTAGILQSGGAEILTNAEVPDVPVSPKPLRDGALALVVGLMLGVGIAFLLDRLDERIRSAGDLERLAIGRPILAVVPEVEQRNQAGYIVTRDDSRAPAAEAYRSLRTAVKFASLDHPLKVIQVTSAATGEGKTTTMANLGVALAQGGDRVVIVCCDLRRPTIHERFGQSLTPGFTDVLVGDTQLSDTLRRYDDTTYVLPAGTPPPNPSELLSTPRAAAVIKALSEEFDVVLLDTPPVLPVTDALVVTRMVDATLVVVDSRTTRRNPLRRTLQLLEQVNAPVLGMVLNGVSSGSGGYGYGYGYTYESKAEKPSRLLSRKRDEQPVTVA